MLYAFYFAPQRYKKTFNSANFLRKNTLKSCFLYKNATFNGLFIACFSANLHSL